MSLFLNLENDWPVIHLLKSTEVGDSLRGLPPKDVICDKSDWTKVELHHFSKF